MKMKKYIVERRFFGEPSFDEEYVRSEWRPAPCYWWIQALWWWFDHSIQKNPRHPHYNVWGMMLKRALQAGAQKVTGREMVPIIKQIEGKYGNNGFK